MVGRGGPVLGLGLGLRMGRRKEGTNAGIRIETGTGTGTNMGMGTNMNMNMDTAAMGKRGVQPMVAEAEVEAETEVPEGRPETLSERDEKAGTHMKKYQSGGTCDN